MIKKKKTENNLSNTNENEEIRSEGTRRIKHRDSTKTIADIRKRKTRREESRRRNNEETVRKRKTIYEN